MRFFLLLCVCALASAVRAVAPIAVLEPGASCAAHDRGYAAALGRHLSRWLGEGGVKADRVESANWETALTGRRLVYLVMCSEPTKAQTAALRRYCARGGRLVSFYSQSAVLAGLMGVRPGIYKRPAPGTFARMTFAPGGPAGSPAAILQSSPNIFSALPIAGRSQVLATWCNRTGRSTGEAAILQSAAGWWVTHVFTADGDEAAKRRFVLALAGAAVPGSWNAAAAAAAESRKQADLRAYGAAQTRRPGEIHAVWDHSGQGLYPGDWPRTFRTLAACRITDLFVNVSGAGFAHYPSRILPASGTLNAGGDQLAACLAAARGTGVRVHAWVLCFTATRGTAACVADFRRRGWLLAKPKGGGFTEYLDPSHPEVRARMLGAVEEVARRYPVAGVHLDFVRWYENVAASEATPGAVARFRAAVPGPVSRRRFCDWRARQVGSFVALARARIRAARPAALLTTAVLGKYPSCVDSVGQDWEAWLDAGLVDYIVPMDYTTDLVRFASYVNQQGRTRAHARKTIAGLGVTANESRLDARQVIDQVNLARRAGLAGVAFFDLDFTLVNDILPILRLGQF